MKYNELRIQTDRDRFENLQTILLEHGYDSMQIDDSSVAREILNDPELYKYDYLNEEIRDIAEDESGEIVITLYFADDGNGQKELAEAETLISGLPGVSFETELTGEDSEWLYKWQENFKPSKVGRHIVVKPGWEEYEAKDGELVIEMDPGMAFGSGLHETTRMCVEGLEKALSGEYGKASKVLDVGTGTGILAMAAVLLGADEALGIDIDEEAVRVASENIKRNGLEEKITVCKGDLMAGIEYEPDIIVANLMADLVMMLSPSAAAQLREGGIYITSGILDVKVGQVEQAARRAGFDIAEVLADGEWRTIIAVRKADK